MAARSSGDGMETQEGSVLENKPRSWKKPKFVPYEPYKGAVTSFIQDGKSGGLCANNLIPIPAPKIVRKTVRSVSCASGSEDGAKGCVEDVLSKLTISVSDKSSDELDELKKELKIQQEINAELKNLLVASIGEDWETRVESLSTDKAILGEYVKKYSDSLTRQTEEKDNISIECDVWKSKFLASSLMVDELARCKAILVCRCQEAREALQVLDDEHKRFAGEIKQINRNLQACQGMVDGVTDKHRTEPSSEDLMRIVSEASMRSKLVLRSLEDRRLYNQVRSRTNSPEGRASNCGREDRISDTPGQVLASKVLMDLQDMPYVVNENLKSASALYFPINKAFPFKCCSHCQGDLKIV
ncbi:unnamed protein product [Notodromas monacha]|uniref:Golgin-45 n=1 Tax=Notodromas monacha TaxID=399045 RepID=A0A7R9GAL2_9CRUS|nr:unnamed protein product [Notodromas monacha]CAG0914135.1 unnamed protein product [Notodromas monacha]